jgi:hypothetical protein
MSDRKKSFGDGTNRYPSVNCSHQKNPLPTERIKLRYVRQERCVRHVRYSRNVRQVRHVRQVSKSFGDGSNGDLSVYCSRQ